MKRLTILTDVDGVLNRHQAALIWYYYYLTNDSSTLSMEYTLEFDYTKLCPLWGMDQIRKALNSLLFFKILSPIPQAQHILRQLVCDGHDIVYYTAQDEEGREHKKWWLENLFWAKNIVFTEVFAGKPELVGDVFIDDWECNLQSNRSEHRILLNTFDKKNEDGQWCEQGDLIYTSNWLAIKKFIDKIAR